MAKTIDKQTMLDLIIEAKRMDPETGSFAEWLAEYLVEHLPALAQPNEWVSTDKCTPEPMKDVLVMFENGVMCVGFTYGPSQLERWSMHVDDEWCQSCKINPAYWMPLPKPPKGTEDVAENATTESGCEYCSGDPMRPLDWQYGLDHIFPDYKYCPMCGRGVRE